MNHIRKHNIDTIFVFDQPVWSPAYKYLRKAGVRNIVSYWGAPISSINTGIRLLFKKLDVLFTSGSPDHYIFESNAMAKTAFMGRGIPKSKVSVIYMGVDTEKYKPVAGKREYAHEMFNIPHARQIVYYSGHMEERKGVDVLMKAAKHLYDYCGRRDFHFLILGNKNNEEQQYLRMLGESGACGHVTFGGYRKDVNKILPACNIGVIASTGWDSFTMSALEIASSGLPLLVSDLQGLVETIDNGMTGYLFKPGDYEELSEKIITLIENEELQRMMGDKARERILAGFTEQKQIKKLISLLNMVAAN